MVEKHKHFLDFINIPFIYHDRDEQRGWEVGAYITSISRKKKTIMILIPPWIEIMDRKDRELLIWTLYQSSSDPREKLLWTEKLEAILVTITTSFDHYLF